MWVGRVLTNAATAEILQKHVSAVCTYDFVAMILWASVAALVRVRPTATTTTTTAALNFGFQKPWKRARLYYPAAMNGDDMIRKQVGRPRGERPLVRLDRLNRAMREFGLMPPPEVQPPHVRRMVGRMQGRAHSPSALPDNPSMQ